MHQTQRSSASYLYSALGFALNVLDLVPALPHHVLDFVSRQLQHYVWLFLAVTVRRQQLIKLGCSGLLPILQNPANHLKAATSKQKVTESCWLVYALDALPELLVGSVILTLGDVNNKLADVQ